MKNRMPEKGRGWNHSTSRHGAYSFEIWFTPTKGNSMQQQAAVLWGNKTSWKLLLVFMYVKSRLVLFIWFFHWAAAVMDGTEWSWDNLRTSLLTLLLSPSLRTFFSLLSFFLFLFTNRMLWFERQGWWAGFHMPCWGACWGWKQELSAFSLHSPCLLLGGSLLSAAYSSPHAHTAVVTKIQSALDWLLLLIGISRKLGKYCWNYY